MADNNEKLEKDLQNQEADIEVDVTKDVAEEAEKQPEEEAQKEPADDKEKESPEEELKEEEKESEEEKNKEEVKEETPEKIDEKEDKEIKDEPAEESEGDKVKDIGDNTDKTEVEDVTDEPSEKERQLTEQLEAYKESEQLRELAIMRHQAESQLNSTTNQVHEALIKTIKKYDIPEDKTMEELKAESPEKAAILEGLLMKAQEVIQDASMQLSAQVEEKAKDLLFNKAGKMFEAYEMTEEQANIAAATFINIMNQVGINDLGEDLAAKVKLSVAQAKMDSPDVVEVSPVQEEVAETKKTKETKDVQKSEEVKDEVPPAEEVVEEKPQEQEKPDISEFMEGIEGNASKASDVNADNVLAKLNALPFKERTKFYKENMDLINEAMKKARG